MQKLLWSVAMLALISAPALAADMTPLPTKSPPFVASPWDGPYIGATIGGGDTHFSVDVTTPRGSASESQSHDGIVGGVMGGYNRQYGGVVLGLEGDFNFTSISGSDNNHNIRTELPWFGTARGRLGYLLTPNVLAYGTAGGAYGRANVTFPGVSIHLPGVGWTAGGGLEWAVTPDWHIRGEYLYVELFGPSADIGVVNVTTKATTNIGRFGALYRF